MRGVNKVIIVGNLGNDPEVKNFSNGGMVCNVSVATSEQWADKQTGERREATEWHRIVFNNRLAEIASQYLRKGSKVYIEGSLKTRKWQDQNGQDRYTTEIRAMNMQMLDGKSGGATGGGYQEQSNTGFQQPNSFTQNQGQPQNYQNQGQHQNAFTQNNNMNSAPQQQVAPSSIPQSNAPQVSVINNSPVDSDVPF